MATLDDKVVAMSFESTKFTQGVNTALTDISKLNSALSTVGSANALGEIEKSANKISLGGLFGVIDKLKSSFGFSQQASQGFGEIDAASNKVHLDGASSAIDGIKRRLHFPEASEGFGEIERASGQVKFTGLNEAIQSAARGFNVIHTAAGVALGNLASQAAGQGRRIASGLFGPIKGGLEEYQTNLNSVQTILANTSASGATLKDVNKALLDLNHYSDKTIYNFSQMAKNIGTFTAAGVDLDTATTSIKGIANLAAVSGSSAEQASTAMYQLSQAISSGRVSLQDWNSVVNAGMGGTVFQRALAQTAQHMGTLSKGAVELKGKMKNVTIEGQSFRESVQAKPGEKSWLTSDVLTKTLSQLSGDMTTAQLKADGYSDAQIRAIQTQAKMAVNAATQVKTLSGVLDTAKEAIGSGWSQTWQTVFGDFGEAKTLFTGMSNAINGMINTSANARNSMLADWKELGGRKDLIEGIKAAFEGLKSIIEPIKNAFRDIFPATTGAQLADITKRFRDFMESVKIGPETAEGLRRSFRGLFALLDIGKQILGGIFTALGAMFGAISDGSGGILNFTGGIGDLIVKLDEWLKKGNKLHDFFAGLGTILGTPLRLIGSLTGALGGLFGAKSDSGAADSIKKLGQAMTPSARAVEAASKVWDKFLEILRRLGDLAAPVAEAIGKALAGIGDDIAETLSNMNFDSVFAALQTGLIAGIFVTIKKALGGGLNVDIGAGFLKNLSGSLSAVTGSLQAMQAQIKANTLLQIAAAVGILAVAVVALSHVDPKRIGSSMTAIAVGLAQLMGAMAVLTKIGGIGSFAKMPIVASGMAILAGAIVVLAGAVLILSKLDWGELLRGLSGVAGIMVTVALGAKLLQGSSASLTVASVGLIALGVALNIMAAAMKIFATMSWEEIGKGLVGAAAGIVAIGLAANALPMSMIVTGPALILLATGLVTLGAAVAIFGSMKLETLGKGLLGIVGGLVAIGLAMGAMPPTLPLTAVGLTLTAGALVVLGGAIKLMGSMDFSTLAKGIIAIGAALLTLAVGLTAMVVALPGAAALAVAAPALIGLATAIAAFSAMRWSTIIKGLVVMGASLVAISVAGLLAAPGLLLLGAALTVFGLGVLAAGAGIKLLAEGIQILAGQGTKGMAVFLAAVTALLLALPQMVINFIKGLVEAVAEIIKLAPAIVSAMVSVMGLVLDAIIQLSPKFAEAATALIKAILDTLAANAGPLIQAGWDLLLQMLKGISDHIGQVVDQVGDIIVKFLNAVAGAYPRIITAGFNLLVNFLKGIGNNLNRVVNGAGDIISSVIKGIGDNFNKVANAGGDAVTKFMSGITDNLEKVINRGGDLVANVITGIGNNISKLIDSGVDMAKKVIKGLANAAEDLATAGGDALLSVLRGIRKWVDDDGNAKSIGTEGRKIATGLTGGIVSGALGFDVGQFARNLIKKIKEGLGSVLKHFGIHSPSDYTAEEVGLPLVQGIAMGMEMGHSDIQDAGNSMIKVLRETLSNISADADIDVRPVITPVLDLTQMQKDVAKMPNLSNVVPITAAVNAAAISAAQAVRPDADVDPETGAKVFKFEQNNYSPEALSEAEIYRQTNNQLSQAKSALGL
jgi:tape measure domain-containing protein